MKLKKYLLFLAVGACFGLYSCEDPTPPPTPAIQTNPNTTQTDTVPKINYVTAKTWRITGFSQGAPGSTTFSDIYNTGIPNCQKDNTYQFTLPGTLTVGPGNIKCNASDADQTGTWDLNNGSTLFTINNPAQTITALNGEFSVVEITANRMILTRTMNSDQYIVTFTAN